MIPDTVMTLDSILEGILCEGESEVSDASQITDEEPLTPTEEPLYPLRQPEESEEQQCLYLTPDTLDMTPPPPPVSPLDVPVINIKAELPDSCTDNILVSCTCCLNS